MMDTWDTSLRASVRMHPLCFLVMVWAQETTGVPEDHNKIEMRKISCRKGLIRSPSVYIRVHIPNILAPSLGIYKMPIEMLAVRVLFTLAMGLNSVSLIACAHVTTSQDLPCSAPHLTFEPSEEKISLLSSKVKYRLN